MPITHHIDNREGIIFTKVAGNFTLKDIINAIDAAVSDPDFRPGLDVLSDHRAIGEPATTQQMESMAAYLEGLPALASAKWAMVVSKTASYGMMRMLSVLVQNVPIEMQVFWDMEEALKWIRAKGPSKDNKDKIAA